LGRRRLYTECNKEVYKEGGGAKPRETPRGGIYSPDASLEGEI